MTGYSIIKRLLLYDFIFQIQKTRSCLHDKRVGNRQKLKTISLVGTGDNNISTTLNLVALHLKAFSDDCREPITFLRS